MSSSPHETSLPAWLLAPFERGIRPHGSFSGGVELEYLLVDEATLSVAPYEGARGVSALLYRLISENGWAPVTEGSSLIGLSRDSSHLSIEPGGAVEIATRPHTSLDGLLAETAELTAELSSAAHHLSRRLLCMGYHPTETKEDVALVPKRRYHLMYPIMGRTGALGQEMMKLTASVQVTLDFSSEEDAMRKYALACRLVPICIALSANSPFRQGARLPYASFRSHIWTHTDPKRTGLPSGMPEHARSFTDYVAWALEAPVYFLERQGQLIPHPGSSFRHLLIGEGGLENTPSLGDWELHLSTLFPWVRLRSYLELRAFDMVPPPLQYAIIALVHGLFYHPDGLGPAEQIVAHINHNALVRLIEEAITSGLYSEEEALSPLSSLCERALAVASQGLAPHHKHLLAPLRDLLNGNADRSVALEPWVKRCLL